MGLMGFLGRKIVEDELLVTEVANPEDQWMLQLEKG